MTSWSIESLNSAQNKIIEHKAGPALVIAGAGSGKTRVITHRVAQLINSGIPASSILLLTFTNKAADEMTQRVGRTLVNSSDQNKIIHGTFHSVANRFLKQHAKLLEYKNNFSILDSSDSKDMVKAAIAEVIGKPGKFFPKAAVLQNIFSLAFNRHCSEKMILGLPYIQRNFFLEQLIYLMVVGDDAQSIYSWRGANFGNMLEFPERYKAVTYYMEENYRSSPEILEAANQSINYNTRQFEKNLFSSLPEGEKPLVHHVWSSEDEANLVLQSILSYRDQEISLNEMSVLYRNHVQSAALQVSLTQAGIPFVIHSGVKFFEQAHIKDLTAFLKVLYNPLDEISWMRLLRLLPGIGNNTAFRIFSVFQDQQAVRLTKDNQALHKLIPKKALENWIVLLECFQKMLGESISPTEMIGIIYNNFYRDVLYSSFENAQQREADIRYLEEFAGNYEQLEAFLNKLSLVGSSIVTDYESEQQDNQEAITLTTIHQAKGLEWGVVIVIGLTEGLFPHQRSLETEEQIEEERRLFYVAMTRAKRHLLLTAPLISSSYFKGASKRSRFIFELADESINKVVHKFDDYSYLNRRGTTQFYF